MGLWGTQVEAFMGFIEDQATEWTRYREKFPERESASGPGSYLGFTTALREWLPKVFAAYDVSTVLDAPCGDWNWMSKVDLSGLDSYIGWDVEPMIIRDNLTHYCLNDNISFWVENLLTVARVPAVDLIICRDLFQHLPNDSVAAVLEKFATSGSRYLLASNFSDGTNDDLHPYDGDGFYCRSTNIEVPPFNVANRLEAIDEPESGREMVIYSL